MYRTCFLFPSNNDTPFSTRMNAILSALQRSSPLISLITTILLFLLLIFMPFSTAHTVAAWPERPLYLYSNKLHSWLSLLHMLFVIHLCLVCCHIQGMLGSVWAITLLKHWHSNRTLVAGIQPKAAIGLIGCIQFRKTRLITRPSRYRIMLAAFPVWVK